MEKVLEIGVLLIQVRWRWLGPQATLHAMKGLVKAVNGRRPHRSQGGDRRLERFPSSP